jgi:LPXTG-motif cell wall-anchored protein
MKKTGLLLVAALALFFTLGGGAYAQSTQPVAGHTVTVTMKEQNGSGESGTATLSESNGQLKVTINLANGPAEPQPAHIHQGTCANLNPAPAYPLTNVVNGTSDTTLSLTMATLQGGQYAINVHKSSTEVATYVSCGDIVDMSMGSGGGTSSGGGSEPSSGSGTSGSTEAPGMPNTGQADQTFLVTLALLALVLAGAGLRLVRRRA